MNPSESQREPSSQPRRRPAVAALGALAMWVTGVMVLFPPEGAKVSVQALRGQVEARNSLRELGQKQLDVRKRKGRFEYDFNAVGFRPDPPVRYVITFPASCTTKHSSPMAVTSSLEILSRGIASNDIRPRTLTVAERGLIESHIETATEADCPDPAKDFRALAIGNLDDDPDLDVWAIDASLELTHIKSDL